ncbi:M23 family metallopeptidase [Cellulomonas soli]|uniref:M23 family metallopeptidase n=1 Tax=Cellulomonas soli TaxID=931535 RepID=UPI003F86EEBF
MSSPTATTPTGLALPFTGRWSTQNSPARRVPSHGADVLGQRFAIDFVAVDERGRSSTVRDWRTVLALEPPERFLAYGRPLLAPVCGVVVLVHDGEPDHAARRSQLVLVPYALGQAARLRQGVTAVAGNHVIVRDDVSGTFVALAHLRAGSSRVRVGDRVEVGQQVAECGSSGNSTQPHVHVQVMDSADLTVARGVPMVFRDFREHRRHGETIDRSSGMPDEGSVVEPQRTG